MAKFNINDNVTFELVEPLPGSVRGVVTAIRENNVRGAFYWIEVDGYFPGAEVAVWGVPAAGIAHRSRFRDVSESRVAKATGK